MLSEGCQVNVQVPFEERVHVPLFENDPPPELEKWSFPAGYFELFQRLVTFAVQVVLPATLTLAGEQDKVVEVGAALVNSTTIVPLSVV